MGIPTVQDLKHVYDTVADARAKIHGLVQQVYNGQPMGLGPVSLMALGETLGQLDKLRGYIGRDIDDQRDTAPKPGP